MTKRLESTSAAPIRVTDLISVRVPEAVRLTGLSRSRIYELMKSGEIRFKKDRASTLILVDSLRAYIESRGPQPTS